MQLNQYANNVASENREQILRDALGLPKTREEVRTKINALSEFLSNLKSIVETPKSIPRVGQAFLLSYFWELQEPERWPVYYGSTKRVLIELGFDLDSQETAGDKYLAYVDAVESVKGYFVDEKKFDGKHPAWFVEHVLWKHFSDAKELGNEQEIIVIDKRTTEEKFQSIGSDFSSWVPSIVGDLPLLAQNIETDWSRERGVKPEKAFETKLRYAFTLLGYEVVELGQGTGREPDGYAVTFGVPSGDYAILYDAKAREKAYSIGTDDRNIFEYIQKYQNDLRRKRISKMSFVVVSSLFVLLFLPPLVLRRWLVLVFFFFNFTTNQLYNVRSLYNSIFNGIAKEAKGFEHYLFLTFTGFTHIVAYEVTLFLFYVIEFNSFAGRE